MEPQTGAFARDKTFAAKSNIATGTHKRPDLSFADLKSLIEIIENIAATYAAPTDFFRTWLIGTNIKEPHRGRLRRQVLDKDPNAAASFLVTDAVEIGGNEADSDHSVLSSLLVSLKPYLGTEQVALVSRIISEEKQRVRERKLSFENKNKSVTLTEDQTAEEVLYKNENLSINWKTKEYIEEVTKIGRDTMELVDSIKDFQQVILLGVEGYSYFYDYSITYTDLQDELLQRIEDHQNAAEAQLDDRKFLRETHNRFLACAEPTRLLNWAKSPDELHEYCTMLENIKTTFGDIYRAHSIPPPVPAEMRAAYRETIMDFALSDLGSIITFAIKLKDLFKDRVIDDVDTLRDKAEEFKKSISIFEQSQKKTLLPAAQRKQSSLFSRERRAESVMNQK